MKPAELSQQLKKPTGENGRKVAAKLNESNQSLYDLAFEMMDLHSAQHILEIGFGNGKHFHRFFDGNTELKVSGVDYSIDMCKEARKYNQEFINNGKLSIKCAETTALPYEDSAFDIILAINVIYFLNPPEAHLKEIGRVLKRGGILLIGYRPKHSVEHFDFTKQHFILYESEDITTMIEKAGLQKVKENTNTFHREMENGEKFLVSDACYLAKKQ